MSTYLYLLCRDCKEYAPVATLKGGSLAGDEVVPQFAATHYACGGFGIGSEHEDFYANPEWTEWTQENRDKMMEPR